MTSKREKRAKKIVKAEIKWKVGQTWFHLEHFYRVRFINRGLAWLAPVTEDTKQLHFVNCASLRLNENGYCPNGTRAAGPYNT